MGSRWKRAKNAFRLRVCTSVPLEPDEEQQPPFVSLTPTSDVAESAPTSTPNPRLCVNAGRRTGNSSNPSTPPIEYQNSVSSPNLRCKAASGGFSNPSAATSPKASSRSTPSSSFSPRLQCMINNSPRMADISAPSSPRSPSRFSLLMSSLRLTRSNCGICTHSTKSGKGTAVFTTECSHSFHFSCISSYVQKQGSLSCPICQVKWKELPMLPGAPLPNHQKRSEVVRVYDDDEPLLRGGRFYPIPEVQEEEDDEEKDKEEVELNGFPVTEKMGFDDKRKREVEVTAAPETALVGAGRGYESYAVVVRVAPPPRERDPARRTAIDLVTVLDVSVTMSGVKLSMMKRSMRLLISSFGSSDRLSIVAFSSASKRLLPLRRMTAQGQRAARRVVDRLVCSQGTCVPEALRKAAKVLEDRRDRNPVASIMLLSDGQNEPSASSPGSGTTGISLPAKSTMIATRFEHVEIPVLYFSFSGSSSGVIEDKFAKCVGRLLSVVVQDLYMKIQPSGCEIGGAYSWHDRPRLLLQQTGCRTGSVVRLGDLYAEEGREILVEVRVPAGAGAIPGNQAFTVHCCFRDPVTQRLVCGREQVLALPSTRPTRAATHTVERLRSRFQTTRAAAQAAHLAELGNFKSAQQVLAAACSALSKSSSSDKQHLQGSLESELAQVQWLWRHCHQKQQHPRQAEAARLEHEDSVEALTPTSAWRAAERLAKVAIMRKSMNRVSDLHGFEDARF